MIKNSKSNPIPEKSNKRIEAPAIVHSNLTDITQTTFQKAMTKYNRVENATSPYLLTKEYLENYAAIFGHN
jgi:hypothetical protein